MIRYWLHEWKMQRRIRAILRYNRKHPEQCINLQDLFEIAQPDTLHVTEFEHEGKRHVSVGYQPKHWNTNKEDDPFALDPGLLGEK